MNIRERVDAALNGYYGTSLEMVLVGADEWDEFCFLINSQPDSQGSVVYRNIPMQRAAIPTGIKLVIGG